jgi:hypothetical protein
MSLQNKIYDFDIDIDLADRKKALEVFNCVPASIEKDGNFTKHNTGVYFQHIPVFPLEGYSSIDHKLAEKDGWFKVDFLNNAIYQKVKNEEHLTHLLEVEPLWDLLEHEEVVNQLYHINNYAHVLKAYKPTSIEQLAMILAIIRPAKKHLMGKTFDEIELTVWDKPEEDVYYFKKAHAIAFATAIVVQLNLICEGISQPYL